MNEAITCFQAGKFAEAEALCRTYLTTISDDVTAYNVLSAALSHQGKFADAATVLSQALARFPHNHKLHHNLAGVLSQLGREVEAIAHYRQALALDSAHIVSALALAPLLERQGFGQEAIPILEAVLQHSPSQEVLQVLADLLCKQGQQNQACNHLLNHLHTFSDDPHYLMRCGVLLINCGRYSEAEPLFQKLTQLAPEEALAHNNLGVCIQKQYRAQEAIPHFRQALTLQPEEPNFIFNLGNALLDCGETAEGITLMEPMVARHPDNINGLTNLGLSLVVHRQPERALPHLQRCCELDPSDPETFHNLGVAYEALKQNDRASTLYHKALQINPHFARPYNNLGNLALADLELEKAKKLYEKSLELNPKQPDSKMNLGLLHLLQGDFIEGWEGFEWRQFAVTEKNKGKDFPQPKWQGEDIADKTILLHSEQGFGDTLQFIRYAPLVKARSARVILQCQPPLKTLLNGVAGVDELYAEEELLPGFDIHLSLLSLPHIFKTDLETIPCAKSAYLRPPATKTNSWKDRLSDEHRLKVGLVWAGNPQHRNDRNRSCSLQHYREFFGIDDIAFYSLQKGIPALELTALPTKERQQITDYTSELVEFSDTAALLANLDLLITVDTAVAHLAGALGIPTYLLIPRSPDWRWLLDRSDSVWYANFQLFRQEVAGDWKTPCTAVRAALNNRFA